MNKKAVVLLLTIFLTIAMFSFSVFADEFEIIVNQEDPVVLEESEDIAPPENTEDVGDTENTEDTKNEEWPTSFSDVTPDHWFYDSVKFVAEKRIFAGTGENTFSPNASLTRAMLVTIVYRYVGSPEASGTPNFSDIKTDGYYYAALTWATQNEIISGYPDGTFKPNASILRQEVAAILCRLAEFKGLPINRWLDLYDFADGGKVTSYARESMQWAYSYKILSGKSATILDPLGYATRAECAKIIQYFDGADLKAVPATVPSLFQGNHVVTYDAMCQYLDTLTKFYPNLIRVSSAGTSEEGRDVKLVSFGTGSRYIYMQGNLHAREYLSLNYLLEILDSYAYAYTTNSTFDGYDVKTLLSTFTIIMIPCANPDGQNIAINGYSAAANPQEVAAMYNPTGAATHWKANAKGVDLNRNFPTSSWKVGSVKRPANAEYAGPSAGSAKETQNIVKVLSSYKFETALDCHTAGNLLYYADNDCSAAYKARAGALATALKSVSGYTMSVASNGPGCANYVRHTYGVPGITVELYPTVSYPLNTSLFTSQVWSRAKDIPLMTMQFLR